eukprot:2380622-Karenia_brevis.AAC.1
MPLNETTLREAARSIILAAEIAERDVQKRFQNVKISRFQDILRPSKFLYASVLVTSDLHEDSAGVTNAR